MSLEKRVQVVPGAGSIPVASVSNFHATTLYVPCDVSFQIIVMAPHEIPDSSLEFESTPDALSF
jgi:hypothetical protein